MGVEGQIDLDKGIERVEIHLRAIFPALMKGRYLLSTLQIHLTEFFRPCLKQPSLSILMNGLFELQFKDRI